MSTGRTGSLSIAAVRERLPLVLFGVVCLLFSLDLLRRLLIGSTPPHRLGIFLWEGIVFGMAIGLAGIGLAMTYSILQFANFAHGDLITAGAFAGWSSTFVIVGLGQYALEILILVGEPASVTSDLGIAISTEPVAILLGLVVAAGFSAGLALAIDRTIFRSMREQSGIALLIASVGVALALRQFIRLIYQPTTPPIVSAASVPSVSIPLISGSVSINAHEATLFVGAAALMVAVHVLLQYTKLGTAMRAMADNEALAQVTGIPTERVVFYTWLIGGALTGAAGYLLALEQGFLDLTLGWDLLLVIFAGVILGGIGSVYGAIAGGLLIGIVNQLSVIWIPAEFTTLASFVIMITVLLVRPQGIFGGVTSV
ncbi:branched-chain amino acid ABC transporter permease [Halovenus halobia]|uniref:branched-chain amino acid ABC transporter permease n=1 Tax=Halovenus halobia TaxID=3396622 RepID=UPI003F5514A8